MSRLDQYLTKLDLQRNLFKVFPIISSYQILSTTETSNTSHASKKTEKSSLLMMMKMKEMIQNNQILSP
jgi:hypothetical protein